MAFPCQSAATWASVSLLAAACAAAPEIHRRDAIAISPLESESRMPSLERRATRLDEPAPAAPRDGSLQAFIDYGLAHSADLRGAFEEWKASEQRIAQASTLPNPRLSYGEFLEEVQTRTGPQERRFGLRQAFPWPGRNDARERVAEQRSQAAWHAVEAQRLQLVANIAVAFHDLAFLGRRMEITSKLLELLHGLEPVVQSRVRAGGGQADLIRLQVEIGRLEDDLAGLEGRKPLLAANLAKELNWADSPRNLALPQLLEPEVRAADADAAFARALVGNPDLMRLDASLRARQEEESLAAFQRKPEFTLGVDYIQTGDAQVAGTSGSGDDPLLLSLSVSVPVWSSSLRAAEQEARHLVRAERQRVESARASLRAEVEEQSFQMVDAARRLALYRDSLIPRATEALELSLSSYRTGGATVLDLIDSERVLLEFELSFWSACHDYLLGEARLEALMGADESVGGKGA